MRVRRGDEQRETTAQTGNTAHDQTKPHKVNTAHSTSTP
jgi:hypothetical protein